MNIIFNKYNPLLISLSAFLFLLPIAEAPKNLALVIFALMFIVYALKGTYLYSSINIWDKLLFFLLFLTLLSTVFSEIKSVEWKEVIDLVRIILFIYMVSKLKINFDDINFLIFILIAGTFVASIYAIHESLFVKEEVGLWLMSVGSENTSAVYLLSILFIVISYLVFFYKHTQKSHIFFYIVSAALFLLALFLTGSRAGVGVFFIGMFFILSVLFLKDKKMFLKLLVFLISIIGLAIVSKSSVYVEQSDKLKENFILKYRIELWKYAYIGGQKNIWFGLGTGNYEGVTNEQLEEWADAIGLEDYFDPNDDRWHSHAHNIYLQAFVDRGSIGVFSLVLIFSIWLSAIICLINNNMQRIIINKFLILANLCLIVLINLMGIVINSFHHEPAMVAALMFGFIINSVRTPTV